MINGMREGDTIFSYRGEMFEVQSIEGDQVTAFDLERPRRTKTFAADELFVVDADDGIWQQTN